MHLWRTLSCPRGGGRQFPLIRGSRPSSLCFPKGTVFQHDRLFVFRTGRGGCGEDAGAPKGLQPLHGRKADSHRHTARRVGFGIFFNAHSEPDLADIIQSSGLRAHRKFLGSLRVSVFLRPEQNFTTLLGSAEKIQSIPIYLLGRLANHVGWRIT